MQKEFKETFTISGSALPKKLPHLHQIPDVLYGKGAQTLLKDADTPIVGIVGARKTTPYGREVTESIARTLARSGVVVVSGLALGVDSIAHRTCIEMGSPTIAVLPCGIDTIYPASHQGLARHIIEKGGVILSEYPGATAPAKWQFIERNRIIAGLADILIITEAAEKSGSLHTARFALELGVTVMAVPGPITSPYSVGTNQLISNGATPLLHPDDVLEELGLTANDTKSQYLPENEAEAAILTALGSEPMIADDLLRSTKLETSVFQTHLTMLEMKGIIKAANGSWRIV